VNRDLARAVVQCCAAAFLLLFLAYPLGLGVWLSFTDARIGRCRRVRRLENYEWLWDDSVFCCRCSTRCSIPASQRVQVSRSGFISRCFSTTTCRSRR